MISVNVKLPNINVFVSLCFYLAFIYKIVNEVKYQDVFVDDRYYSLLVELFKNHTLQLSVYRIDFVITNYFSALQNCISCNAWSSLWCSHFSFISVVSAFTTQNHQLSICYVWKEHLSEFYKFISSMELSQLSQVFPLHLHNLMFLCKVVVILKNVCQNNTS